MSGMNLNVPPGTPEYAIDFALLVSVNAMAATLYLGKQKDGATADAKCLAVVSPQLMKAMMFVFKRHVESYEATHGMITLPSNVLHELGEEIG